MDGCGGDAELLELLGHEVGMTDGDAEGQGAMLRILPPFFVGMAGAGESGEFGLEAVGIEANAAPRDFTIVNGFVEDAVVGEGCQQLLVDSVIEVASKDEVIVAEGEDVGLVGAIGRGGKTQEETRLEMSSSRRYVGAAAWWNSSMTM